MSCNLEFINFSCYKISKIVTFIKNILKLRVLKEKFACYCELFRKFQLVETEFRSDLFFRKLLCLIYSRSELNESVISSIYIERTDNLPLVIDIRC